MALPTVDVLPGTEVPLALAWPKGACRPGAECLVTIEFATKAATSLVPAGHVVAWDQFLVATVPAGWIGSRLAGGRLDVHETTSAIEIAGRRFRMAIDRTTGLISSWTHDGRDVLVAGPAPNFWRSPTDNDYGNGQQLRSAAWREASRHREVVAVKVQGRTDTGQVGVLAEWKLPAVAGSRVSIQYEIYPDGTVILNQAFTPSSADLPEMPRFGLTMRLPRRLDSAEWYGRGPQETYWDRYTGAALGRYTSNVADLVFPYERPQETGNRIQTRWVALSDGARGGLLATGLPTFDFSAYPYAHDAFDGGPQKTQRHTIDVKPADFVTLNLDYRQMGLGGDTSWGALPHHEYLLWPRQMEYRVALRPFGPGDPQPPTLASRSVQHGTQGVFFRPGVWEGRGAASLEPETFDAANRIDHLALGKQVSVRPEPILTHVRSGAAGLTDGIRGSADQRGGEWLTWDGPVEMTVDLGQPTQVSAVRVGFLARAGSSHVPPDAVRLLVSTDGERFEEAGQTQPSAPAAGVPAMPVAAELRLAAPRTVRFVRVAVPKPSTGRVAVDEIVVR
jgi:beta-galactosidase